MQKYKHIIINTNILALFPTFHHYFQIKYFTFVSNNRTENEYINHIVESYSFFRHIKNIIILKIFTTMYNYTLFDITNKYLFTVNFTRVSMKVRKNFLRAYTRVLKT